jgi:hypothetical protein
VRARRRLLEALDDLLSVGRDDPRPLPAERRRERLRRPGARTNPGVGTPLMQADPRVGVELPLRMLIWEDPTGTHVGYLDPRELADRYALDGHQQTLERQAAVLTKLAAAAAG